MSVTINTLIQTFLGYLKFEKRYSAHTLISYQTDLTDFSSFMETEFGNLSLQQINHGLIRSWLAALKEKGLTAKSINRKISSLRSFFKYCLKTGEITTSPMTKVINPKTGQRLPVFIKQEDALEMILTVNQSAEDWKTLNAKMLVSIFYATGMRLNELISLKEKQVDIHRSQIKVLGKGNKERVIPVGKEIIGLINDYMGLKKKEFSLPLPFTEETGAFLLVTEKGKKLYPKYAYLLVRQVLGQSATLDKQSPHVLRHTFATHLMNNGADLNAVKELLGHSSLAATQVYTHNTIEKLKEVHKKAHPKA